MLDTSAYAAFKRGNESVIEEIRRARKIIIPLIVLGELLAGFDAGNRSAQNRVELEAFMDSKRVELVPIVAATAERYAHIYIHLRKSGKPIPTNDLWIAASAMEHGAELLTADQHFMHVPQILVRFLV